MREEMRMNVVGRLVLVLLLAGGLACVEVSAQPQNQPVPFTVAYPFDPFKSSQSESGQLAKQYVEAKKDEEKKEVRKHLTEVLSHQFDQHIQEQQKELEDLDKQIAQLRTVLKKRLDAKSTIVERRLEQLIQEAEGLGWNAPRSPQFLNQQGSFFPSSNKGVRPEAPK
jgi:hypothetical protein